MEQFIGTIVTSAVVAYVCTHTRFGKMTFSAVDAAIEHFAELREYARRKRKEDRQKEKDKPIDVKVEEHSEASAEEV